MRGITPNLWFDDEAEEAAKFYVEVFGGELGTVTRYGKATEEVSGKPAGSVMTVSFTIAGQEFVGINGGPQFPFSEAVSFQLNCEDQAEIDELWAKLTADGGEEGPCGWLKDRFGVSWQVVPVEWSETFEQADDEKRERMMAAMLKMRKLDIEALRRAAEGEAAA
jgi:predicted 3-demethylubiquinone-9 3-methyltransferase (glyoxalase superfamily)